MKKEKFLMFFLSIILLTTPLSAVTANDSNHGNIQGCVDVKVSFPSQTIDQLKETYSEIGADVEDLISKGVLSVQSGLPQLQTNLPNTTVKIDEKEVNLENNEFKQQDLSVGQHKVGLYYNDTALTEKTVDVKANETTHVHLQFDLDFNDLSKGMNSLSTSDSDNIMRPMGYDEPTYNNIVVGSYFGKGKGRMKMLNVYGHVSCNKSDYDQGENFPNNNSDCAKAVIGGLIASQSIGGSITYGQGIYCLQEAMDSVFYSRDTYEASKPNIYCNGKQKSTSFYQGFMNRGYNCSSFNFIKSDERLNKY